MIVIKNKFKIVLVILIIILGVSFAIIKIPKILYPLKYKEYILKYSEKYNLDPLFVASIIKVESGFKIDAKSNKNARGLMQITEGTGEWIHSQEFDGDFNNELLHDPEYSIYLGCWYLNYLRNMFGDNELLVLAAYNGGPGSVSNWLSNVDISPDGKNLDNIPFKETDQYVKKVKTTYNIYKFLYKSEIK